MILVRNKKEKSEAFNTRKNDPSDGLLLRVFFILKIILKNIYN